MVEESSECSCTPQLHLLLLHAFLQSSLGGQKAFIGFISGTQTKPTTRCIECWAAWLVCGRKHVAGAEHFNQSFVDNLRAVNYKQNLCFSLDM